MRRAVDRGQITPDHVLQIGERTYPYFHKDRVEEIRRTLGLPRVTADTIKQLFFDFVREMDMSASYKPVMLVAVLESVDESGRARLADVTQRFRQFYLQRKRAGLPAEKHNMRMNRVEDLAESDVQQVLLQMPFEKFERRRYLRYDRDLAFIRFDPQLWRQLAAGDRQELKWICDASIEQYYRHI